MFEAGEFVIYGTAGVCKVEEVTTMSMGGGDTKRLFYVLNPSSQKGGKIFTPVDSTKTLMRPIMNREQATQLINHITSIDELWIPNEKQREGLYKECMNSCDCREWIKIIKTLYLRKAERSAQGKKITSTDEKYLRMAEDCLYSELEIPLGIPKNKMEAFIREKVGE